MTFTETKLKGSFLIDIKKIEDHRGFFSRSWCQREFAEHDLVISIAQSNIGFNQIKGTLRGMHFQIAPHGETKLVRCTMGAVLDVIIDLRRDSPTYMQWVAAELTADNRRMMYVPEGFAHGYQTLVDNTELLYSTSEFYAPELARGVRFNDPKFCIKWPLEVQVISDQDARWPDHKDE